MLIYINEIYSGLSLRCLYWPKTCLGIICSCKFTIFPLFRLSILFFLNVSMQTGAFCHLKKMLITFQAKEKHRVTKYRKIAKWAADQIQSQYIRWKQRQFLLTLTLRLPTNSLSPISCEWITAPRYLTETSRLLKIIFHKWRVMTVSRIDQVPRL